LNHRISEEDIAYGAMSTLEEWFRSYFTVADGRQYRVVQVEHDGTRMVVEVQGTPHLPVEEEQFEVEIRVRKVDN